MVFSLVYLLISTCIVYIVAATKQCDSLLASV